MISSLSSQDEEPQRTIDTVKCERRYRTLKKWGWVLSSPHYVLRAFLSVDVSCAFVMFVFPP